MAMGADDSILIDTDQDLDGLTTAKALAAAIKKEGDFLSYIQRQIGYRW